MERKFTVKEIAFQAGLGTATVDRVLHGRDNVRQVTRDRVVAAIEELDRQHTASQSAGRRMTIDVVVQAPNRFTAAVRDAIEAELPTVRPAAFRARFHMAEIMEEKEIISRLYGIARRGTHGIILKVPATSAIQACIAELADRRVPVVTYVTDIAPEHRLAYVGMQNMRAGATAAYLMHRMMGAGPGDILITQSSQMFLGEEERRIGFVDYLAAHAPHLNTVTVSEGLGRNRTTGQLVDAALEQNKQLNCVYSIGGGNRAILDAFARAGRKIDVFAAHDLDRTNRNLLDRGALSFVIHHNLRQDARRIAQYFGKFHRLIPADVEIEETDINIACPVGRL
jgi:LacI family transcriptional regulator